MRRRATLAFAMTLAITASGCLLSTTAQAQPISAEPGKYCTLLYGEAEPGEFSPLLAQACSDVSMEKARARLGTILDNAAASESAEDAPTLAASTRLMLWFQHQYYLGSMAEILGSAGDCDYAGYSIPVSGWWSSKISSVQGAGRCNTAYLLNVPQTYAEVRSLPQSTLGSLNDNIGRIQVFYS